MRPLDIDSWVERLSTVDMPIFARTAQFVTETSAKDRSTVTDLARVILQDPSLTSQVLKMANSIHFNPEGRKVSTISRAIMQLGFKLIKSMCISASLMENVLKGNAREQVFKEMAQSLHAAVQARSFASIRNDKSVEEVFAAALLFRIGSVAFWCFGGEFADKIEETMQSLKCPQIEAEEQVLGFRLHQLTARLACKWNLGGLLQSSLKGDAKSNPRTYHLLLGHKLAQSLEHGWDSPETTKIIKVLSKFLRMDSDKVRNLVQTNAEEAQKVAREYGMGAHCRLIPLPGEPDEPDAGSGPCDSPFPEGDPLLQLEILRELSALLKENQLDINLLFSTLLEGIFRGIGMDRVMLIIFSQDRRRLVGKYGLGWSEDMMERFVFTANPQPPHIFSFAVKEKKPLWVNGNKTAKLLRYITPDIKARLSTACFFVMPLVVKNRSIGLVCADREPSGRELDDGSFASFHFFSQLANAALSSLYMAV